MKLSLPNIKIGSAGVGFILCIILLSLLWFFLSINGQKTIEDRQDRTAMAEVILNQSAYNDGGKEDAQSSNNLADKTIEKDLPPSVQEITETEEVSPTSTRMPLFDDDESNADNIIIVEDNDKDQQQDLNSPKTPPRIALVISDMGLSASATKSAIETLPKGVTLAFAPYAKDLKTWVEDARRKGHDVLISVPMEPETFPRDDPGPNALLTSLPDEENISRLNWALSQSSGYVGIVNFMGSRFTANQEKLSPIMEYLKDKNIMVLDSGSSSNSLIPSMARVDNITYAQNDRFIDNNATPNAIDKQLEALENIALKRGKAIGIGFPYPVTFERVLEWSKTLQDKGIILVPISDLPSKKDSN